MPGENQALPADGAQNLTADDQTDLQALPGGEGDANTTDDAGTKPQDDTGKDGDKRLSKLQRRIDRRTADLYRERAEKEALARENAELRSRANPTKDDTDPQADGQRGGSPADVEKRAQELARDQVYRDQIATKTRSMLDKGKALEGFTDAVDEVNHEIPLVDRHQRPTPFMEALLDADDPAALMHHLGTNPELLADLAGLSPAQLGRKLERIEASIATTKPEVSKAPRVVAPLKGAAAPASPRDAVGELERIRAAR